MKILFVLLGKIKILTLQIVYFPHQLIHLLFLTPLRISVLFLDLELETIQKMLKYYKMLDWST
jgi:hypothetical protein